MSVPLVYSEAGPALPEAAHPFPLGTHYRRLHAKDGEALQTA